MLERERSLRLDNDEDLVVIRLRATAGVGGAGRAGGVVCVLGVELVAPPFGGRRSRISVKFDCALRMKPTRTSNTSDCARTIARSLAIESSARARSARRSRLLNQA